MKLFALSDLHVDHLPNRKRIPGIVQTVVDSAADVLVIAGDLSHRLPQLRETLAAFSRFQGPKFFVAGNHDVWLDRADGGIDSWTKWERVSDAATECGFLALDRDNGSAAGFSFVGSMGWYDYSFANEMMRWSRDDYVKKSWHEFTYQDLTYTRWGMDDEEVVDRILGPLKARLEAARPPIVFVSHHLPQEDLVRRRGVPGWDFFNAFMGSRRIEDALRLAGISRFVFGHSHRPFQEIAPGKWRINNPLGYPREALQPLLESFQLS